MFICGRNQGLRMHDDEPDTFKQMTLPEAFCDKLLAIGITSSPNEISTGDVERGEYYSRYFTSAPRMVTNRGSVDISGTNIDSVHIIQKG